MGLFDGVGSLPLRQYVVVNRGVDTKVPKYLTTEQANNISIYVYIDVLFACFGSFAFRYLGSDPNRARRASYLPYQQFVSVWPASFLWARNGVVSKALCMRSHVSRGQISLLSILLSIKIIDINLSGLLQVALL